MEQMRLFANNEIEPAIDYLFGQNMLGQIANVDTLPKEVIYQVAQTIFGKSVVDLANASVVQEICITKFIPNLYSSVNIFIISIINFPPKRSIVQDADNVIHKYFFILSSHLIDLSLLKNIVIRLYI